MKRIWNNIKAFIGNLKKLYRLSKILYFEDDAIIFNSSIEATDEVRAGTNVRCYCAYGQKLKRVHRQEEKNNEDFRQLEK